MTTERTTMNGKPVFHVPIKTILNLKSGFEQKLLCDGPAFALGEGCAYSCSFCYVPAIYRKLDRVQKVLTESGKKHEDMVILRTNALEILRSQLLHPDGKPKWKTPDDRRVVYTSPADDCAANMDLVRATAAACSLILEHTNWQIRLLSKSNLFPKLAAILIDEASSHSPGSPFWASDVYERMIFGVSTGTLDDKLAAAIERGTPLVSKRIESIRMLQDNGFRTFGMICPSLPENNHADYYGKFDQLTKALRVDRMEHVWAEVINARGEAFTRTQAALIEADCHRYADSLELVSTDPQQWEYYNRATFLAHAAIFRPWVGKLRYLTYVNDRTRPWWEKQIAHGAVLL